MVYNTRLGINMKRRVICFVSVIAFLFASCEMFQEPVKEYLEYWTNTIQVSTKEIASPYVKINGIDNVSAVNNNLEIYLYLINPKGLDFNPFFTLECEGQILNDSSSEKIDSEKIKITATLNDSQQGKTITLSGYVQPENKKDFNDTQLLESNPELFYSCSFIQNTAPDSVANFTESTDKIDDKFYIIFDIPNQNLQKNKDIQYKIQTYERNNLTQQLTLIDEETVSSSNNKNSLSNGKFYYYSTNQKENLGYEYSVTVLGKLNLISDKKSTDPGLGNCPVNDPEFTVADSLKEITVYEGYETYTISTPCKEKTTFNITAKSDISYQIQLDSGELKNTSSIEIPLGKHTVKVISKKDRCETNTYEKKLFIQGTLKEPEIRFTNKTNTNDIGTETYNSIDYTKVQFSYLTFDTLNCSISNDNGTETRMDVYLNDNLSNSSINLQPDEYYNIKVTQDKEYYKSLVTVKNIKPVIKPITLKYKDGDGNRDKDKYQIQIQCKGFGTDKSFNLRGTISLDDYEIWAWNNTNESGYNSVSNGSWSYIKDDRDSINFDKTYYSTDEKIKLKLDNMRRHNGDKLKHGGNDWHFSNVTGENEFFRELKEIKKGDPKDEIYGSSKNRQWIFCTDLLTDTDGWTIRAAVYLTAVEEN